MRPANKLLELESHEKNLDKTVKIRAKKDIICRFQFGRFLCPVWHHEYSALSLQLGILDSVLVHEGQ